ncbi:SDR family oxidoreductase [Propioniciclava flava]|uniref:NAD(P)-dependent oxidoreductase n=1 Tax=Propioniciclava flava TaxID=2072026 RepID=A0A4Q2EH30_9ACTN|nr:SDR family oxidoreductase [Propioniciclava flava]RXW31135.1 NAD(P)-dependent oxidoreductase [Propioniciclava flava]
MGTIAVTGATGHLGGLIIDAILARGVAASDVLAIVRDPAKAARLPEGVRVAEASYEDQAALTAALTGVDTLLFVSGSEPGKRAAQHRNVVAAAQEAGVGFIAYTSLLDADTSALSLAEEHVITEKLLADSGIDHAVLRNGWYWENYASALSGAAASGEFHGAAGEGLVSGAARKDYAEAAAVVGTTPGHAGKVYELAGDPALSYPQIAEGIAEVTGRLVVYVNQSEAAYADQLASHGLPQEVAQMLAGWDTAIAGGALFSTSTDLADLIGRPSTSLVETLRAL